MAGHLLFLILQFSISLKTVRSPQQDQDSEFGIAFFSMSCYPSYIAHCVYQNSRALRLTTEY